MTVDKNLIGGSVNLLILTLLDENDMYGYQIIKEIDLRSDSTFQFKEGSLYPVLHKLKNNGYVEAYKQKGENGKDRIYYKITKKGQKQLVEQKEQWNLFSTSVNKVIGGSTHAYV